MNENLELLELIGRKKELPTICEGKRDAAALKRLGFTRIIVLNAPLYAIVERFDKKQRVQVLTDLDSEGRKLYSKLSSDLKQRGVYVDNELREALFRTQVRQIESLATHLCQD